MENKDNKIDVKLELEKGQDVVKVMHYTGEAPKLLDQRAPIQIDIKGTLPAVREFLSKRVNCGLFGEKESHILVDREQVKISLVFNERDALNRGTVVGTMEFNPKFKEFGINTGKLWTPTELGIFCKMNRSFFSDINANRELVSTLLHFKATVQSDIDRSAEENGSRVDNYAQIVNSNLPKAFILQIPIFKGMEASAISVETFANIDGRDVVFTLLSPAAQEVLESIRDSVIDKELEQIREIAPDIAIIEQ